MRYQAFFKNGSFTVAQTAGLALMNWHNGTLPPEPPIKDPQLFTLYPSPRLVPGPGQALIGVSVAYIERTYNVQPLADLAFTIPEFADDQSFARYMDAVSWHILIKLVDLGEIVRVEVVPDDAPHPELPTLPASD